MHKLVVVGLVGAAALGGAALAFASSDDGGGRVVRLMPGQRYVLTVYDETQAPADQYIAMLLSMGWCRPGIPQNVGGTLGRMVWAVDLEWCGPPTDWEVPDNISVSEL